MIRPSKAVLRVTVALLVIAIGSLAFLYLRLKPDEKGRVIPWGEKIDTRALPEIRDSFNNHEKLVISEGLPRRNQKEEISTKETTKIRGSYFYAKTVTPSESDAEVLAQAINDEAGIVEWAGAKLCGGFHPDFALQWSDSEEKTFHALICFGCSEIKIHGAGTKLYADIGDDTYRAFAETLSAYGGQRPKVEKKN
ncbi:MAG: hypothetical protein AAGA58_06265 [Verrucomicrobiota bacterium]